MLEGLEEIFYEVLFVLVLPVILIICLLCPIIDKLRGVDEW